MRAMSRCLAPFVAIWENVMRLANYINLRQMTIGATCLAIGAIFYVVIRPPGSVYFVPSQLSLYSVLHPTALYLAGCTPSVVHILAISLLTAGVLKSGRHRGAIVCLIWSVCEVSFELGQHPKVSIKLAPRERHIGLSARR